MKKRMFACLLVVILAFSLMGATTYSQTNVKSRQEDGQPIRIGSDDDTNRAPQAGIGVRNREQPPKTLAGDFDGQQPQMPGNRQQPGMGGMPGQMGNRKPGGFSPETLINS